jgi:hypothetical protein
MPALASSSSDVFFRVLAEVVFRSLEAAAYYNTNAKADNDHSSTQSSYSGSKKKRPRALTPEGKKVNFFFEVKFVSDEIETKGCLLQKKVSHRSYFPYFVDYPKSEYMHLWYNNQSLLELGKKYLSNVVLLKGQSENPIRVKQEAELYSCPKLKALPMNKCKWIKSEKIRIDDKSHKSKKQATVKMMNRAGELRGNHIAFITRVGKSMLGMQRISYEVFNCNL